MSDWLLNLPAWVALPLPVVPLVLYVVGLGVRFAWEGSRPHPCAPLDDGHRHDRETFPAACRGARR